MELREIRFDEAVPVDGYGPGFVRVGGRRIDGRCLIYATGVRPWGGVEDAASLLPLAGEVDVIFVGTGAEMAYLPPAFRTTLEEAGLGVEPMATPAACRTYNVLLSEGRRVALALLPV